ncbi:MAG: SLC13 family permease, partial [Desulfosarcina sp.]|nr:SLC13 family permease [Desulfobacterales bacterium]
LLMPLSVGALISGMMTLIATAPNLVVAGALQDKGLPPLGFFSFTPFGIAALIVGTVYMVMAGRGLLAKKKHHKPQAQGLTAKGLIRNYGLTGRLNRFRVMPDSPLVDRAVALIQMREQFGLHIIAFEKHHAGQSYFVQSAADTVFESNDHILIAGRQEEADRFAAGHGLKRLPLANARKRQAFLQEIGIAEIMLAPESKLIGKTLQEIQFSSRFKTTVLSIRRRGELLIDDLMEMPLDFGDAMLVNASWPNIQRLRDERQNFVVLTLPQEFNEIVPARKLASWSLIIIGAMVAAMASGIVPTVAAAMLAAVALVLTGCVKLVSVYRTINWQAVVLIAGILPLATALVIGVSPQAFAMTVAIACSAAFVTPVSSPVNMLIQEPGGYHFMDFVKVGLPLLLLTMVVTVALAGLLYL